MTFGAEPYLLTLRMMLREDSMSLAILVVKLLFPTTV